MTRIKQCSVETISLIKKMFSFLIKEAFRHRFQISCPKHLLRVRDLSFLPHLLNEEVSWHDLTLQQIAHSLGVALNDFEGVICQPTLLCPEILRADRAVFTKLIQDSVSLRRDNITGDLPMDDAIISALSSYEVGFHLMPVPKQANPTPAPKADPARQHDQWVNLSPYNRWSPYKGHKGHKGKGKGFKGKGRSNLLPRPSQNRDNVSTDPHNRRLCFGFNLGRCDAAPSGGECKHGWHLCCRRKCQAPHPDSEHDRQAKGS